MLDFPTPTSIGQVYAGTNGVNYIWTGTLWLASGASAGGDFYARKTGSISVPGSLTTLIPDVIISGNASTPYSVSTGRYTPPAGRYCITGAMVGTSSVASHLDILLRKNGTSVQQHTETTPAAGNYGTPSVSGVYDANGTDWFDIQGAMSGGGSGVANQIDFYAFPISGIKGPPGDATPGTLIQTVSYQTGAVATGAGTIPADDTIPQVSEGTEFMSLAITPRSVTSKLIIDVTWCGANSVGSRQVVALFQDAAANALAVVENAPVAGNTPFVAAFTHNMISGTTSSTTFRVRAGTATGTTMTFNGAGGARLYGGVMVSSIVIQEVAP